MHPCLFRVSRTDPAGNAIKGQFRMCGKKAIIAYKVEFKWSDSWKQMKTVCFCSLHAPHPDNGTQFNMSALGTLSYARHAIVSNQGEVSVDCVKDSRVNSAMDNLVESMIRLMNNKNNKWATDEHWREIFERSITERAVKSVVND